MSIVELTVIFVVSMLIIHETASHGYLRRPPGRSSAWRDFEELPKNYDDNALWCGNVHQDKKNPRSTARCGVCGDHILMPRPRPNERGGIYGKGRIVQSYVENEKIVAVVMITKEHEGHFNFSICPLEQGSRKFEETEECFDKNPLMGRIISPYSVESMSFDIPGPGLSINQNGYYEIELQLPAGLTCERCSFRWEYTAGNNWGWCTDEKNYGRTGCGPQETFRNCADISIIKPLKQDVGVEPWEMHTNTNTRLTHEKENSIAIYQFGIDGCKKVIKSQIC
ncbi:hypothetical protein QAD02_005511 [Eretmocerus hayati]|uniref:Uncharacterized protein n=1 Tax=Eretmocerus hayati TaxID=131215 RepID=A0ACC2NT19_9HYME|nr:hypothetical protein QAD02_005511 [Eretmocerus hayati]